MSSVQADIMVGSVKNIVDRLSKDFSASKPPVSIQEPRKSMFAKASGNAQVVATFSYKAIQDDELSLTVGDIVEVLEEVEDGWSRGRIVKTGEMGMFPTNFVENKTSVTPTNTVPVLREERPNEPEAIKRTPSVIGVPLPAMPLPSTITVKKEHSSDEGRTKEMARVKFVYEPQHPDELKLGEIGALIELIRKDCGDPGWFEGELNGKVGLFPDNFVELVQMPVSCTSGNPKLSIKHETKVKAPILAPSGSAAVPPAVPAKPKPKLTDSNSSLNSIPTSTVPSIAKTNVSSNFTDIRNRLAGLKIVAPGDPVPSALSKSTIVSGSSQDTEASAARPMSTVEMSSVETDQPTQLSHVTKDRPRGPGKRPMSMMLTKNKGSNGNILESPDATASSVVFSAFSSSQTTFPASSEAPISSTISGSPTRLGAMKPVKEEPKEDLKTLFPVDKDHAVHIQPHTVKINSTVSSIKVSPSTSSDSDAVSRKEYNDLLARVTLLEARLSSLEGSGR